MSEQDIQDLHAAANEIRRTSYGCGHLEGREIRDGVREQEARRSMETATSNFTAIMRRIRSTDRPSKSG